MKERLRQLGVLVMPWQQAVETPFDLAISACSWGIEENATPLVVMPYGATSIRSRTALECAATFAGVAPTGAAWTRLETRPRCTAQLTKEHLDRRTQTKRPATPRG